MTYQGIGLAEDDHKLVTSGLLSKVGYELLLPGRIKQQHVNLMCFLIDYIQSPDVVVNPEETLQYGIWVVKFVRQNEMFCIFEKDKSFDLWVEGAETATEVYAVHEALCQTLNVTAAVPKYNQKIVVSDGVLNGEPVEAVRYPSPDHMSGWWLTADEYNGDVNSLHLIDLTVLIKHRFDLIKYMILPFGFRFHTHGTAEIWYDIDVFQSQP